MTLAAAAILAAADPALAVVSPDPTTPTPTPTPTPTAAPAPVLHVYTAAATTAHPGDKVVVRIQLYAVNAVAKRVRLQLSAGPTATFTATCALSSTGYCHLLNVTDKSQFVQATVAVPTSLTKGAVAFTATVTDAADGFAAATATSSFTVAKAPTSTPTPTPTPTTSTHRAATSSTVTGAPSGGPAYIPPSPAGSGVPAATPSVALPPIAPAPSLAPAVTPTGGLASNTTDLRSAAAPRTEDLTFQRVASTQVAWLAALLVAFSVLLTQVRLGRRPIPVTRKPAHGRTRRGLFQA